MGASLGFALPGTLQTRAIAGRRGAGRRRTKDRRGLASSADCCHFEEAAAAGGGCAAAAAASRRLLLLAAAAGGALAAGMPAYSVVAAAGGDAALGRAPPLRWRRRGDLNGIASGLYIHIHIVPLPCQARVCHVLPGSRGPPVMSYPAVGARRSCLTCSRGPPVMSYSAVGVHLSGSRGPDLQLDGMEGLRKWSLRH